MTSLLQKNPLSILRDGTVSSLLLAGPSLFVAGYQQSCHCNKASISEITSGIISPHRFLIASFLPILRAELTASARLTFPISLRFNFDGLGSFDIHSGTGEPD